MACRAPVAPWKRGSGHGARARARDVRAWALLVASLTAPNAAAAPATASVPASVPARSGVDPAPASASANPTVEPNTAPAAPRDASAAGPASLGGAANAAPSPVPAARAASAAPSRPALAAPDPYVVAGDPSPAVRLALAQALADERGPRAVVLSWLLAQDPVAEVATAAATSAVARCPSETPGVCVATLGFFLRGDADTAASAVARDGLWTHAPATALAGATPAARLAAVERLAARLMGVRPDLPAQRLLRLLAEDPDPEVQQAAAAALMTLDR